MSWTPFFLKRIGPRGPDSHQHMFCVGAKGNPELVRTGESDAEVLVNGTISGDPSSTRGAVQRLVDALNAQWEMYLCGEFHEDSSEPAAEQREAEAADRGRPPCTKCGGVLTYHATGTTTCPEHGWFCDKCGPRGYDS